MALGLEPRSLDSGKVAGEGNIGSVFGRIGQDQVLSVLRKVSCSSPLHLPLPIPGFSIYSQEGLGQNDWNPGFERGGMTKQEGQVLL